ncbi:MAG: universal stress protein [Pseudonocardiaceae bacterium]
MLAVPDAGAYRAAHCHRRRPRAAAAGGAALPAIGVLPELARDAAMLVVGRHRGGLIRQAVLGSVSAVCVRHATCPVVVIPAAVSQPEAWWSL